MQKMQEQLHVCLRFVLVCPKIIRIDLHYRLQDLVGPQTNMTGDLSFLAVAPVTILQVPPPAVSSTRCKN